MKKLNAAIIVFVGFLHLGAMASPYVDAALTLCAEQAVPQLDAKNYCEDNIDRSTLAPPYKDCVNFKITKTKALDSNASLTAGCDAGTYGVRCHYECSNVRDPSRKDHLIEMFE